MTIASPLSGLYAIVNRQGEFFFTQLFLLAGRSSALVVGGLLIGTVIPTLILYSTVGVVVNLLLVWRCLNFAGASRRLAGATFTRNVIESSVFLVPAACAAWLWKVDLAATILGGFGAVAYSAHIARRYRSELSRLLRRRSSENEDNPTSVDAC